MIGGIKKIAKGLAPPVVVDATKRLFRVEPAKRYVRNGAVAWSAGYAQYKSAQIARALADENVLALFRGAHPLPDKYGYGIDERCVEYPWLVSHLPPDARRILDAGSVLNHDFVLSDDLLRNRTLHILTLGPEPRCFWNKGISYLFDDLRTIPIRDGYYDAVVCLSTLEHIGCDNTQYTRDAAANEDRPQSFRDAVAELRRVLRSGGSLFVSVPYGAYRHHGTFQQFDRALLDGLIGSFEPAAEVQETFYRYGAGGWQLASAEACADAQYVEWFARSMREGRAPHPLPCEPDHAAAARAVACLRLVKPQGE